jgi:hypothetical protein
VLELAEAKICPFSRLRSVTGALARTAPDVSEIVPVTVASAAWPNANDEDNNSKVRTEFRIIEKPPLRIAV